MFSTYFSRILLFICLVAAAQTVRPATQTVTSLDDAGAGTLRSAIEQAASGDVIDFQPGLSGTITLQSPLPILDHDLTIGGPGAAVIKVSGNNLYRVFFVETESVVLISGLTIADGLTEAGVAGTDGFGGGIFNAGELTLEDSIVQDNIAEFGGGGISSEGVLNVRRSTITSNSTDSGAVGGGIDNFAGNVSIVDSTLSGNLADFGAGVSNDGAGEIHVTASTISSNASMLGGGISNASGTVTVLNSTVTGNSATDGGGGMENLDDATLVFSTVAGNSSDTGDGGGILNDGTFTARNSLVVNSTAGDDCANFGLTFDATGDNLDSDGSCPGFVQTTAVALDLGALADNGGPTATHALGETSTAVDAVANCTDIGGATNVDNDQRGVARPQGTACDIGAFELEQIAAPEIILDPARIDFGERPLGLRSPAMTVEVTNTGTQDLMIDSLSIQGPNAGDFGFDGDICSGQTIGPSATCTFEVVFTPQEEGTRQAQVSIPSNAPDSPHQVDLIGIGSGELIFADDFEGS